MDHLTPIRIVRFKTDYGQDVINLILSIQQDEFKLPITEADQPDLADIPNFYQADRGNFWVALDGQQVVGTIALLDIGDGQGALRKMFVRQDYRGGKTGTAKKLLAALVGWGRDQHIREIYLGTTPRFLAAHSFYEKNGFVEIGKQDLPITFPIMAVDKKFYKFELRK
ncbi:MAG: GNAT family N-acetyltransferase [Desulfobacter sp.]|nr:MAG: GNAT family N-acetyltransferase [Desulfobacter sp.]